MNCSIMSTYIIICRSIFQHMPTDMNIDSEVLVTWAANILLIVVLGLESTILLLPVYVIFIYKKNVKRRGKKRNKRYPCPAFNTTCKEGYTSHLTVS